MRTYWLSFCDTDAPEGQQFKGVCIVDVTVAQKDEAELFVTMTWGPRDEDAYWLGAAITQSKEQGCNPGGEVMSLRIDDHPNFGTVECPRNRLLSKSDLEILGHVAV
jgi:hypothetical protein